MQDISIELYEKIRETFDLSLTNSEKVRKLLKKLVDQTADYETATEYAEEIGRLWAVALRTHLKAENLPDNKLYFNIAQKTITPALTSDYKDVSAFTAEIQKLLNTRAGISFNSVIPALDTSRINNLISKIASDEVPFKDTSFLLGDRVIENYSRSVVTDFIEENASFQKDAGLKSYITRTTPTGCCSWCSSVTGAYEYGKQPADFFKVHDNCDCIIKFYPAKERPKKISFETVETENGRKVKKKVTAEL